MFRNFSTKLAASISKVGQSKHFRFGVPFIGLLLGASFALPIVTSFRYEFRKTKGLEEEDIKRLEAQGIHVRKKQDISLEQLHFEHMLKTDSDTDDYENIRIPRPEEEATELEAKRVNNRRMPRPNKSVII
jgi:hypothetical protein